MYLPYAFSSSVAVNQAAGMAVGKAAIDRVGQPLGMCKHIAKFHSISRLRITGLCIAVPSSVTYIEKSARTND